ncbi:hypothetical protein MMC34_001864 [Xylographa carneopallida]|nr:hypothetical protein [Xylographa carneopallida]
MAPYAVLEVRPMTKQGNEDEPDHRAAQTPLLHSSLPLTGPSSSRSSHHSPISHGSSQSSLYLSPPVTDSETESAPYKPGENDNTSLNMHKNRKRRKKAINRRKDQPATLSPVDSPFDQLTFANHVRRRGSAVRSSRSHSSHSDDSGSHGPLELGQINTTNATDQAGEKCGQTNIAMINNGLIGKESKLFHDYSQKIYHSADTEILRPSITPDSTRRWSVVEDSVLLSPPAPTTYAAGVLGNNPFLLSHVVIDKSAKTSHERRIAWRVNNGAYMNDNQRPISTNGFNTDTPATITLRKASNSYRQENPRRQSRCEEARVAKRRTAKNSQPIGFLAGECSMNSPQQDSTLSSTRYGGQNEIFAVSLVSPRSCTLLSTSTGSSDQLTLRRRTIAADPALTFAEVHTTPEVFSLGDASRKHSQLAIDTMRRSSTVMIWSGSSVHEIIWDKDDAPSSSSSRPSLSQAGSESNSERRSPVGSPRKTSIEHNRFQNIDFSAPASRDIEISSDTDGANALQEVARQPWTVEQADSNLENVNERAAIEEPLKTKKPSRTTSRRGGRWSKSWRADISNSIQGVESFPPLLERGSTYEWRKVPLVDIDDPTAGQSILPLPSTTTPGNPNPEPTNEVPANHAPPAPRKPSSTHLGAALGTSSHHRRPSTGPHHQGPYSSLVDLSKSVSRRASQLTHRLSDRALDWESPPPRRMSKSADPLSKPSVPGNVEHQRGAYAAQRMAPVWRKHSNGGLWINTASGEPEAQGMRVAGLEGVVEDEGGYGR